MQVEYTESHVGVTIHEGNFSPDLKRCPIKLVAASLRQLKSAICAALYGGDSRPQSTNLILKAIDGKEWVVEVEPFSDRLAYTFWRIAE